MAKTNAMQRSLKFLRSRGWQCGIVEHWNPHIRIRQDLWHFADILACRHIPVVDEALVPYGTMGQIALIQTFPQARWKDHIAKLQAIPELKVWKQAGGLVRLHGWALKPKDGVRGAKKVWTLREEAL